MNTYWTEAAQLYLILHQSCFSLKFDHQDLLRNVCFQKLYFHCSSAEEWSSSHIFWGAFISSSLNHHWIALHYMFGSFQSHLKTYYWRYRVTTHFYIILCQYLLYWKISLIYKHQNFITFWHILYIPASEPNCIFLSLWIKLSCFSFIFSLYHTIWAIKTWWIKYDTEHKYICKLF